MLKTTDTDYLSARGCSARKNFSNCMKLPYVESLGASGRVSLESLVQDYRKYRGPKLARDMRGFSKMDDKQEAVRRAASGRYSDGKKKREHQYRLKNEILDKVANSIDFEELVRHATDFKSLHEYLYVKLRCKGYADLAIYDAAQFIYAALSEHPVIDIVYLHRGAAQGFDSLQRTLIDKINVYEDTNGRRYAKRADFPVSLSRLPGEQIENFLCIYHKVLDKI